MARTLPTRGHHVTFMKKSQANHVVGLKKVAEQNKYSNSVSNKVESRRDETLLRTELRTNSATVNNEEYFLRNFG